MGTIVSATVLGLVQGLTEFLPVSSSGHLVLLHGWLQSDVAGSLAFDVLLHGGTLLAVLWYFRRELGRLLLAAVGRGPADERRLAWQIVLATVPAAVVGLAWGSQLESAVRLPSVVAVTLVIGSLVILVGEGIGRGRLGLPQLAWGAALALGVAQAFALVPGFSRSGLVMAVGLAIGLTRPAAVRFAFLLAVPAILGAFVTQLPELLSTTGVPWAAYLAGFAAAAVAGYAAIAGLLRWVSSRTLIPFVWYRLALAAAVIAIAV